MKINQIENASKEAFNTISPPAKEDLYTSILAEHRKIIKQIEYENECFKIINKSLKKYMDDKPTKNPLPIKTEDLRKQNTMTNEIIAQEKEIVNFGELT